MNNSAQSYTENLKASDLNRYLLGSGISVVDTQDLSLLLGIPKDHVRQRMAGLVSRGEFAVLGRGVWCAVGSEYQRYWKADPPQAYIDEWMRKVSCDYCVGWLSAADLYGASHQKPQVFQVATSRTMADRQVGRSQLEFHARRYLDGATVRVEDSPLGSYRVATPETTVLMCAADPDLAGGIDNCSNVVLEMFEFREDIQSDRLLNLANRFPLLAVKRIGWILDRFLSEKNTSELAEYVETHSKSLSFLSPVDARRGEVSTRWQLVINREIEPDVC
jgi:predicted transcriptional regulator of viral defense system